MKFTENLKIYKYDYKLSIFDNKKNQPLYI